MEISSFFNSYNGDRRYKAENWAAYFSTFISNGVFPAPSVGLALLAGDGMSVILRAGKAFINGYRYENTDDLQIALPTANGALKRIDRIVIRYDLTERRIRAAVKSYMPSSSPKAPDLQRDADAYELCVGDVLVNAGAITISLSNITDTRFDNSLCGIVGWMVNNVDTTALFAQFTKAFEERLSSMESQQNEQGAQFKEWFEFLQYTLDGDTAGHLLNLIEGLRAVSYTAMLPASGWSAAAPYQLPYGRRATGL